MVYVKAAVVRFLCALAATALLAALLAGSILWAFTLGVADVTALAIPALLVSFALLWVLRLPLSTAKKLLLSVLCTAVVYVLAVAVLIVDAFGGIGTSGSAGIGAVSVGISEPLVESLPILAFAAGFVWTVRRYERQLPRMASRN